MSAFYLTAPSPCPYLAGRWQRKIITPLADDQHQQTANRIQLAALVAAGFRRSEQFLYRPNCDSCQACIPVRIVVGDFSPSRTQRRQAKLLGHGHWQLRPVPTAPEPSLFRLFQSYQQHTHPESDMAQMDALAFAAMLADPTGSALLLEWFDPAGQCQAAMLVDALPDGYSANYSFYAPHLPTLSLGTQLVVELVRHARSQQLAYVYLGYYIRDCRKMAYKINFQPLEQWQQGQWAPFSTETQPR